MADLAKIKRNVAKMVSLNAPESDIDSYIASQGVSLDDVRNYKPSKISPETEEKVKEMGIKGGWLNDDGSVKGSWVNSDWIRKPAALMQGNLNAALNPIGFMAKGLNYSFGNGKWELPESLNGFKAETDVERALQGGAETATNLYGAYALGTGAANAGLLGSGASLPSKIATGVLNPENAAKFAYMGGQGRALADYVNPESNLARFGLEVFGASPVQITKAGLKGIGAGIKGAGTLARKGMALASGVSDDALKKAYEVGKNASIAENNINHLLWDENNSKLVNLKNRLNGGTYYDKANKMLGEETERLARQEARRLGIASQNGRYGQLPRKGNELVWAANKELKDTYSKLGLDTPDFVELPKGGASAEKFRNAMLEAKKIKGKSFASVDIKPVEDYKDMRLFLTKDGKTGFAINSNNGDDIVSVFNGGKKGLGDATMDVAVAAGGKKLDAYDTFLPEIYSRHGFKPTERLTWDDKYMPSDWSKSYFRKFNYGQPDVVMMEHDPSAAVRYTSPNSLTKTINKEIGKLDAQKAFTDNLMGKSNINKVVDDAFDAYKQIQKQASAKYAPLKEALFKDTTKLDLTDVNRATDDMIANLYDRGILIGDKKTEGYIWKIANAVKMHSAHPDIKGLDSMKRSVEAIEIPMENKVARRAQTQVANAIKDSIIRQRPEYKTLVSDYADAMKEMKLIKDAVKVGGQNRSTAARSLMQAVRDGVNANFGSKANAVKMLEEAGGKDLTAALAGQELSPILPKGIERNVVSGILGFMGLAGGVSNPRLLGLAAASPRLDAIISNTAGRVMGKVPTINVDAAKIKDAAKAIGLSEIIKKALDKKGE